MLRLEEHGARKTAEARDSTCVDQQLAATPHPVQPQHRTACPEALLGWPFGSYPSRPCYSEHWAILVAAKAKTSIRVSAAKKLRVCCLLERLRRGLSISCSQINDQAHTVHHNTSVY